MTESQLQAKIFQWHWNKFPAERGLLFHVNGKAKNAIEGNKFKGLGVVSGVSDLVYLRPDGKVLFIELKTSEGRQSPAQLKWQALVESFGHQYLIVRSVEEFVYICGHAS